MKHTNGFWVDDHNNQWSTNIYHEDEAEQLSKTLIACKNCCNCRDCNYCHDCNHCYNCSNCRNCNDCNYCNKSRNCRNSSFCNDCNGLQHGYDCNCCSDCCDCNKCRNCSNCRDCYGCHNCRECEGYISNPICYITDHTGINNNQTTFYYGQTESGKSLQVISGFFHGTLEEFKAIILKTYADNKTYKRQSLKEIKKVKRLLYLTY